MLKKYKFQIDSVYTFECEAFDLIHATSKLKREYPRFFKSKLVTINNRGCE
jgi:hypothetical protein